MAESRGNFLKFIWKVENFSYIWHETDNYLTSPDFHLDIFEGSDWCLRLYPRGTSRYEEFVGARLYRLSSCKGPVEIIIDFEITIIRKNGEAEYIRRQEACFRIGDNLGFDNLIHRETIIGRKKSTLLPEDTLTLQCSIYPKNGILKNYTEVMAKTHTEIQRYCHQWNPIDLNRFVKDYFFIAGMQRLTQFYLFKCRKSYYHPHILQFVFKDARDLKALHYRIGVLDSEDSAVKLLERHIFNNDSSSHLYFTLIAVPELMKRKDLYLPNDKLRLDCEFTFCYGKQHSQVEVKVKETGFKSSLVDKTASYSKTDLPAKKLKTDNNFPSLKNDIQNYREGALCDFTIKVESKNFQVHKAVLCAKSPVFKTMLSSNMVEKEKGLVDIQDLEEDTVQRMLTYMYTDMAGELDYEAAKKLYYAADKYDLITLKTICSEVLKHNLSVPNVREVLSFAHMHGDEDLKNITLDFICHHEVEVLYSIEWYTFITEDAYLAAETMHQILLKKSLNQLFNNNF